MRVREKLSIPYVKFHGMFRGYEIVNKKTGEPITKIEYYWGCTDNTILDLLNRSSETHRLMDKPGWVDGVYYEEKDYTRLKS